MATFQRAWALPLGSVVLVTLICGCGGGTPASIPNQAPCCTVTYQVNSAIFVTETTADIHAANEHVAFLLGKADGSIHSLQLDGQELLANDGFGNVDFNDTVYGFAALGQVDASTTTYAVRTGSDHSGAGFADIVTSHQATSALPFT